MKSLTISIISPSICHVVMGPYAAILVFTTPFSLYLYLLSSTLGYFESKGTILCDVLPMMLSV